MQLDLPTLTYVGGLISLGACIGFSSLLLVLHELPVLRTWVASMWVVTLGIVLVGLRNQIPDSLSIVVGNAAIAFSNVLMIKGMAMHVGHSFRWRAPAMVVILYAASIAWFQYVHRDLQMRIHLASVLSIVWDIWTATLLLRFGQREIRMSCRLAAAVAIADAAFFAARLCMPVSPGAGNDIMKGGAPVTTTYVIGLLINLASYFALVLLITERLIVDLRHLARIDALTGLLNRGAILADGERTLLRSQKHGQPFAVLILDLDHFKQVNDTWGHEAGDTVLRHVSTIIRQSCLHRAASLASRYGGEEFLLVLPGATLTDALQLAEQLRHALAHSPVMWGDRTIPMTTSIGVAVARPHVHFEQLIAQADEALYRAKSEGRNGVSHAVLQAS